VLPAPARRPPRRHGGVGAARRGRGVRALHALADPLDERLDYPQVDRMFAGAEQPAERIARPWPPPRAPPRRSGAGARSRAGSSSPRPSPSSASTGPDTSRRSTRGGDGVPPAHRAPHDLRERAGGDAPGQREGPGALPRPRAPVGRGRRAAARAARLPGRPHAARAGADERHGGRPRRRRGRPHGGRARAAHGTRAPGAHLARAARAQAGPLPAREHRPRRPVLRALLPLHLAHPALSRPGLPPRAALRRRGRGGGAAARHARGARHADERPRARRDGHRARRGRRGARLPARARALRARLGPDVGRRGRRPHRRGRLRRLRGVPRDAARPPDARRLVGAQRGGDDPPRRGDRRDAAPRRPDLRARPPRRHRARPRGPRRRPPRLPAVWQRPPSASSPRATWRRTARRATATSSSTSSSAASRSRAPRSRPCARAGDDQGRLRGHQGRGAVAPQRPHPAVRRRRAGEPRARAHPQAPGQALRDRALHGPREGEGA
jgi:hypothetical protein